MRRQQDGGDGGGGRRGITAFGNGLYRAPEDPKKARKKVGEHHDGSYGVYMTHKIQKLRHQNESFVAAVTTPTSLRTASGNDRATVDDECADASAAAAPTPSTAVADSSLQTKTPSSTSTWHPPAAGSQDARALFHGVHVFVDGYTVPSKEEIRSLLLVHGGGFEHYETSQVTHIVATHLATSKLLQYK
ncbi:hypothetical protein P43SY_005942 [Pythium insidiosum]|uniref:BRCT domain-containing protein n=1 Tax=Pythium insidiosum TaxID=114742 RepID=A0AAD5QAW5_PYTIN|nr:hypothetical protein P43SY_005942 [Pythium insidiosum]